jgi:DNA-binding transcriptional LysR family regulator
MIDRLSDLLLFTLIVERGSLTGAANELGLSPSAVSLRLSAIEKALEVGLLRRSTRRLQLTEAGDQVYRTAKRMLGEMDDLQDQLSGERGALAGPVRVSAPLDLGRNYIAPTIDALIRVHPGLAISLVLSDTPLDLSAEGIDLAVRYGRLPDSALRLRRISSNRRVPVASPAYLDRVGRPARPQDLKDLNCLALLRGGGRFDLWPFQVEGRRLNVKVTGDRDVNDGDLLHRWAIEGAGVVLKSAWDVAHDLRAGRLEALLVPFCPVEVDLQIVLPPGGRRPRRVDFVADHLAAMLRQLDQCLDDVGLGSVDMAEAVSGVG